MRVAIVTETYSLETDGIALTGSWVVRGLQCDVMKKASRAAERVLDPHFVNAEAAYVIAAVTARSAI